MSDTLRFLRRGCAESAPVSRVMRVREGASLKIRTATLACAALFVSTSAWGEPLSPVLYGPVPAWVAPPPASSTAQLPSDAPLRFVYQEQQQRVARGMEESYSAYRVKLLKPEALALGNLRVGWSPSAGSATVHFVRIIRDGAVI